jgi:uncharacterized protein YndB with AHSA1/START domain
MKATKEAVMSKPEFVYVTYIASTPQKVFDALRDPELTKDYWGRGRPVSDWQPGSRWEYQHYDDASQVDVVGTVLECEPPRRLVVTWGKPGRSGESRVTYQIDDAFGAVRLTVTHDQLEGDPETAKGISQGWPAVLSSLKSLLETGEAMAMTKQRWGNCSK